MMSIATTTVLIRVLIALLCGIVMGLERERLERAAGLRTHALVAVSSCLVMIVSIHGFGDTAGAANVALDPSRVAAQVVSGIGFLGAGVIIFRKNTISGLTTAASIWSAAAVGLACGGGLFWAAAIVTTIILGIQTILRFFEYRFFVHHHPSSITARIAHAPGQIAAVDRLVRECGIGLRGLRLRTGREEDRVELILGNAKDSTVMRFLDRLAALDGVGTVTYHRLGTRTRPAEEHETDEETYSSAKRRSIA
jgi:putative Mg2+ transporter-C (MgtC) family protein